MEPTRWRSHQRSILQRHKPLSSGKTIRTCGQTWRKRFTSKDRMAQACWATSICAGRS